MNKIAEVRFAYSPKNEDELELTVGDKIEVIGVEEEGWWKGKLKGRIGVFPSNFVDIEPPVPNSSATSSLQQQHSTTSNKLNSIFGSKLGSKSSLSSNSINSTSNNSLNNNFASANNNTSTTMSSNTINTHQAESTNTETHRNESYEEACNNSFSERRPKPIRGIGYGDIFAAGAKPPRPSQSIEAAKAAVGSIVASERLNSGLVCNTLQKPVPKKPPPPTPAGGGNNFDPTVQNGSSTTPASDQAPALPPKPNNQSFSPFMQTSRSLTQQQSSSVLPLSLKSPVREQARVFHDYPPSNDDELELKVGDIINIIDKKSEDHGWWKGELNGKIGVFPDNFVQLITVQEQAQSQGSSSSAANQSEWSNNRTALAINSSGAVAAGNVESRVKSVFSSTPKGFSKELESNLERHNNNPASFLSLKRNKLPGQSTTSHEISSTTTNNNSQMNLGFLSSTANSTTQNGHASSGLYDPNSPTKLNHVTANRAKGPARRPPSNILRRSHVSSDGVHGTSSSTVTKDVTSNDDFKEEQSSIMGLPTTVTPINSLPITASKNLNLDAQTVSPKQESLIQQVDQSRQSHLSSGPSTGNTFSAPAQQNGNITPVSSRPSSINSAIDQQTLFAGASSMAATPKISQRTGQQISGVLESTFVKSGQKTPNSATGSPPTSTPPWMVNLRKTNAEKKREPCTPCTPTTPIVSAPAAASFVVPISTPADASPAVPTQTANHSPLILTNSQANGQSVTDTNEQTNRHQTSLAKSPQVTTNELVSLSQLNDGLAKYDKLYKQISNDVNNGFSELRSEFKQLRDDVDSIRDLKETIECMKAELKVCQSAYENQRKYIKELVTNLADERKKIASIKFELDRNLK